MTEPPPLLLSPKQIAERWGCSTRFVQLRIERGELIAMHFGPKLTRVPLAVIEAYEASLLAPKLEADEPAIEAAVKAQNAANIQRLRLDLSRRRTTKR